MSGGTDAPSANLPEDDLFAALSAFSNPRRLRVIATLAGGRNHVSQLDRQLEMFRPLLRLRPQRWQATGLVMSQLEVAVNGTAMRNFEIAPFSLALTPALIAGATRTLPGESTGNPVERHKELEEQRWASLVGASSFYWESQPLSR